MRVNKHTVKWREGGRERGSKGRMGYEWMHGYMDGG